MLINWSIDKESKYHKLIDELYVQKVKCISNDKNINETDKLKKLGKLLKGYKKWYANKMLDTDYQKYLDV